MFFLDFEKTNVKNVKNVKKLSRPTQPVVSQATQSLKFYHNTQFGSVCYFAPTDPINQIDQQRLRPQSH